ncbi:hypothetical protein PSEUDO8Z_100042 [Pseudomonas sp. 8Z]|uniref:hypothetical protein n=1 Tax=Pseudomonas sp. 8Z TaxID=2653166 RepID=UPI0012EF6E6A|nr:hypothetical protein [Pseudomonas sp. 8Z]VXC29746.1 hypothetical protein PSEUDO8Z_100042 [Pseudomonas sp. 8Z]
MKTIDAAKTALESIREARLAINQGVEELTLKISQASDKKRKLQNKTLSLADYEHYFSNEIKMRGERYAALWLGSRKSRSGAAGIVPHSSMRWSEFESREAGKILDEVIAPESLGDALCFLFPETIQSKLMSCLRDSQQSNWTSQGDLDRAERMVLVQEAEEEEERLKHERDQLFHQLNEINQALQAG